MRVLVLGGAGYIGSVVVEKLSRGHDVVVFDNLSKGHREAVKCKFVEGDISNRELLSSVMKKYRFDAVMHFCALSVVPESMRDPGGYFRNNVSYGFNILDCMAENKVKKIIFSSSAAVYGEPKRIPIREEDVCLPTNPYGESKLMFEKALMWYYRVFGISFVCLRYFNAAGASGLHGEDHSPESHLIPIILECALGKRKEISVFGDDYDTKDGSCVRDYIHVLDLASAHILALGCKEPAVFNLGSQKGYSVKGVISEVERISGKRIKMRIGLRREGDPAVLIASSARIKRVLGWKNRFGLKEIISSAWEWKKKHPDGY